ncbi:MAG TPA: hypothetical protein VF989_20140 [Polyangiaceae bacterium]|jgi:hypothetical protein
MRLLFDIVHPAHVHFFKNMITALRASGHEIAILARQKDVTAELLDRYDLPYEILGQPSDKGRFGQGLELLRRDVRLVALCRRFRPRVILTRSPAGVQAGRLLGIKGVFDTDDGPAAGIHWKAAAPFAHVITTPDCTPDYYGPKHLKYPGYKQMAYLHPDHFQPDEGVLSVLGVGRGERFFIVRFVAWMASHDNGEGGLAYDAKVEIIRRLERHGRVFISSEAPLPPEWESRRFSVGPHQMHHALAFASLLVGESQTMAAEAAVLGVPNIRVSSWAGRLDYLNELEQRYQLTRCFAPGDLTDFWQELDAHLANAELRPLMQERRLRMLGEKQNVARWYVDYLTASA